MATVTKEHNRISAKEAQHSIHEFSNPAKELIGNLSDELQFKLLEKLDQLEQNCFAQFSADPSTTDEHTLLCLTLENLASILPASSPVAEALVNKILSNSETSINAANSLIWATNSILDATSRFKITQAEAAATILGILANQEVSNWSETVSIQIKHFQRTGKEQEMVKRACARAEKHGLTILLQRLDRLDFNATTENKLLDLIANAPLGIEQEVVIFTKYVIAAHTIAKKKELSLKGLHTLIENAIDKGLKKPNPETFFPGILLEAETAYLVCSKNEVRKGYTVMLGLTEYKTTAGKLTSLSKLTSDPNRDREIDILVIDRDGQPYIFEVKSSVRGASAKLNNSHSPRTSQLYAQMEIAHAIGAQLFIVVNDSVTQSAAKDFQVDLDRTFELFKKDKGLADQVQEPGLYSLNALRDEIRRTKQAAA